MPSAGIKILAGPTACNATSWLETQYSKYKNSSNTAAIEWKEKYKGVWWVYLSFLYSFVDHAMKLATRRFQIEACSALHDAV